MSDSERTKPAKIKEPIKNKKVELKSMVHCLVNLSVSFAKNVKSANTKHSCLNISSQFCVILAHYVVVILKGILPSGAMKFLS
jgi:hypothetical protein